MASALEKIITGNAKRFDALRSVFFAPGATLELLKTSASTDDYVVIQTVASGWYLTYSNTRQQSKIQIATTDSDFTNAMAQTEAIRVDGTDVYAVTKSDGVIAPQGETPFWTIYCTREPLRATATAIR